MDNSFEFQAEEPEEKKTAEPALPVADLVVDAEEAGRWLEWTWARRVNEFNSILFLGEGVREKQLSFLVSLLIKGLHPSGVIYVPVSCAKLPVFASMKKNKTLSGRKFLAFGFPE